jgi:acyl-CoA synthetase (NDP forming)
MRPGAASSHMDLTPLLAPTSVAVVGASDDKNRIGGRVLANVLKDFVGTITPVNPRRQVVQGFSACPDVSSMSERPDLAIVVSPREGVLEAAYQCAERRVPAMIVITSGFAETDEEGARLQAELAGITAEAGIALAGPNCVGLLNLRRPLRASFVSLIDIPLEVGNVAVVSQSGAFGLAVFEYAQESGLGASYLCTTGNEAGVTCADLIAHLVEQPDVDVVAAYLEGIKDPERFLEAGRRALELGKPLVVMKVGGSSAGGRAAVSHTGALSVPDRVVDALFDRVGAIRVESTRQLIDCTKGFSGGPVPCGKKLVVLTGSGGLGVTMADAAERAGLEMPQPSEDLVSMMRELVPPYGSLSNPIDHTAQLVAHQDSFAELIRRVATAEEYDAMCMATVSRVQRAWILDLLAELGRSGERLLICHSHYSDLTAELCRRGVPAIGDPVATIGVVATMARYGEYRQALLGDDDPLWAGTLQLRRSSDSQCHPRALTAEQSRLHLERAGVPFTREVVARTAEEAKAAEETFGTPVALKLNAEWMPNKSDAGGVFLNLQGPKQVGEAFACLAALGAAHGGDEAPAVLVQEMIPDGVELVCGGFRDPVFGPLVTVGLGGKLVEIIDEQQYAMAPVSQSLAARMIERLAGGRLAGRRRGLTRPQIEQVAEVVSKLSAYMSSKASVLEVDVNPLIVTTDRVVGVDALVAVEDSTDRG